MWVRIPPLPPVFTRVLAHDGSIQGACSQITDLFPWPRSHLAMSLPSRGDGSGQCPPLLLQWPPGSCRMQNFRPHPAPGLSYEHLGVRAPAAIIARWATLLPRSGQGPLRAAWGLGTRPALSCPAVRFDWDKSLLKVYSASSRQWLPVCSSSWNSSHSLKTCQQLGFERWAFPWGPKSRGPRAVCRNPTLKRTSGTGVKSLAQDTLG